MGIPCADHVTPLYPQKLALTSPTGGGRSVGIVRSRTKATELLANVMIIQVRYDTMYYYDVVRYNPAMSPQVPCKSKGQYLFSLLVFIGCNSGCNSGLGWAYIVL